MDGRSEDQQMEAARKAAQAAMPGEAAYEGVGADLVQGLRKRDLKYASALTPELITELGSLILPSYLVPLSYDEALAMAHAFPMTERTMARLSVEDCALFRKVEEKVQQMIDQVESEGEGGIFVKLSFMSPKDVVLSVSERTSQLALKEQLDRMWEEQSVMGRCTLSGRDGRMRTVWLNAMYQALRVTSGQQAVRRLCSSFRRNQELSDSLIDRRFYRNHVVVRPWLTLRPGFEFRVFVNAQQVTAASQYETAHYAEVWARRDWVREQVFSVAQEVVERVGARLPSFVVDVVVTQNDRLFVCELNPFAASSSGCLFSWRDDRRQLMLGPLEWRFVPPPGDHQKSSENGVPEEWQQSIDEILFDKRVRASLSVLVASLFVLCCLYIIY